MKRTDFLRLLFPGREDETYSYSEIINRAKRWTATYRNYGAIPGDRIVVILKHSIDLYTSYLGALLGGFVPSMFAFPSAKYSLDRYTESIGKLLDNADASLVVVYPELKEILKGEIIQKTGLLNFEECVVESEFTVFEPDEPGRTAILQYSSGTTGLKKGVALSHHALLWQVDNYADMLEIRETAKIVSWLPLYHDMGLIACFFLPFIKGIPLVAMSPLDWVQNPAMLPDALSRYKGTLAWMPNFAFNFLAKRVPLDKAGAYDLSHVRGIVNCAEPLIESSIRNFCDHFAVAGFNPEAAAASYAMAEVTYAVTSGGFNIPLKYETVDGVKLAEEGIASLVDGSKATHRIFVSSGKALPETDIKIVDSRNQSLPERHVGEIIVNSPCMLNEYYRNPEATEEAIQNGYYYTGDIGYLSEGHLFVIGRKKDMLIIGGVNLYPQDVEEILNGIDGIHPGRNVVFGIDDENEGTQKLVVLAESKQPESTWQKLEFDIRAAITERMEVTPADVRILPHMWLLKSSSGKISRKLNRDKYLEECTVVEKEENELPSFEPSEIRESVVQVVRKILQATGRNLGSDFTATKNLFSSGLIDSFHVVDLLTRLEDYFNVKIPDTVLGSDQFSTVEQIVTTITKLIERPQSAIDTTIENPLDAWENSIPPMVVSRATRKSRSGDREWTEKVADELSTLGVIIGKGFSAFGPVILRIDGYPNNLVIKDNVTLMPWVDLKNREEGRIILHDGVFLDTNVRLVAANRGVLEIGQEVTLAVGTIVNAGVDVHIGHGTISAPYCNIVASEHHVPTLGENISTIAEAGYDHAPILIGKGAWLGAYVFVEKGSIIGDGAVIGVRSTVSGVIPSRTVAMGTPAKVIRRY
ncbi:AMP-binding protein [bacterium]|nr:AMP-binding protein [bacterium]